jgi:hypothetical protein
VQESVLSAAFFKEPIFKDTAPAEPPPMPEETTPVVAVDDLEVPAFMRRERRLYQ